MDKIADFFSIEHLPNWIASGIVVVIAIVVWALIRTVYRKYNEMRDVEPSSHLGISFVKYGIILLAIIGILQINGVNITSLVASLGIAGAVGALAVQDFFKDVIMGLHISADKFFALGDIVRYNDIEGEVTLLTLRTTKIRDLATGNTLAICNRNIAEITLVSDIIYLSMPYSYELSVKEVGEFIEGILSKVDEVENVSGARYRGPNQLEGSDVTYMISFNCDPHFKLQAIRDVKGVILSSMAENGWSVPYEHIVVSN